MKNDITFARMRSGDHLGDAKMLKKGTLLRRINFFINCNRQKRFSQNNRRRADLQNLASNFLIFTWILSWLFVLHYVDSLEDNATHEHDQKGWWAYVHSTAWCSEIGSLASLHLQLLHASSDVREPISLCQAVHTCSMYIELARFPGNV